MPRRRRIIRYQEQTVVLSDCRSLIQIDADSLKRAEQKRCKDLIHKMDLARERIRRFNEEDQPAFQQWIHATFGKEITSLRELAQKLNELQRLVHDVEEYKLENRCSYYEAYRAVIENRNHALSCEPEFEKENDEDPFRDDDADARDEFDDIFGDDDFRSGDDPFESSKGQRDFRDAFEGFDEPFRQADRTPEPTANRLKTLYRSLARKLHPDVNEFLDQKRKDLWHQVQSAYDNQDLERLEALAAMSDILDDSVQGVESVWSLKSLFEELSLGLRHLQRQVTLCGREPAWGFKKKREQPKKIKRERDKVAAQLRYDESELLDQIDFAELYIERWKTPPASTRRKPSRVSRSGRGRSRSSRSRA